LTGQITLQAGARHMVRLFFSLRFRGTSTRSCYCRGGVLICDDIKLLPTSQSL
jgi:hypothetical protein